MSVSILKWGNSAALRLPKNVLETLSLHIGDNVNLILTKHGLMVEPCKPTLEQLLAQITEDNKHSDLLSNRTGAEML